MPIRPHFLARLGAAMVIAFAGAAHAGPSDAQGDAVMQLLQDKGLVPAQAEAGALIHQVRDAASDLVMSAMNFLGVKYRRGGQTDQGFDCSGFTRHVFEMTLGLVLPRRADQQARDSELTNVPRDQLQPGDLVFFNTMKRAFSHVGIYVGDGKFIHSPRSGAEVRIEDMRESYWAKRFSGARRAEVTALAVAAPAGGQ